LNRELLAAAANALQLAVDRLVFGINRGIAAGGRTGHGSGGGEAIATMDAITDSLVIANLPL
jgi:hypothetical protein